MKKLWPILYPIAAVMLFLATSTDEIIPTTADGYNYASVSINHELGAQRSGLSYAILIARSLGIPYRIFLNLLLIVAGSGVAALILRLTRSQAIAFLGYLLVIFSPWFMTSASTLLSEPLYSLVILGIVSCSALFFVKDSKWWLASISSGMMMLFAIAIRPEEPVILVYWCLLMALVFIFLRNCQTAVRPAHFLWLILPLVMAGIGQYLYKQYCLETFGVRALSKQEAPELGRLMSALGSIPPDEEIRYCPVRRETFRKAAEVSPTMNQALDTLLDTSKVNYGNAKRSLGLDGEIGNFLNWHLVHVFGTSPESYQNMAKVADDIQAAQKKGTLEKRFAMFPMDPLVSAWLPDFPGSYLDSLKFSFFPKYKPSDGPYEFSLPRNRTVNGFNQGVFSASVVMRESLYQPLGYFIGGDGWTNASTSPEDVPDHVIVTTNSGQFLARASMVINEKMGDACYGLRITDQNLDSGDFPLKTIFHKGDQIMDSKEIPELKPSESYLQYFTIVDSNNRNSGQWSLMVFRNKQNSPGESVLRNAIINQYGKILLIALIAALLTGAGGSPESVKLRPAVMVSISAFLFILIRSGYYTLVEVWLQWGAKRYVEPNTMIAILLMLLVMWITGCLLRRHHKRIFALKDFFHKSTTARSAA